MSKNRFTLSSAVYLMLINNDKILLLRRFNTGWSDGLYSLPAGHIEGNEPLRTAMCREAKEEVGIIIKPEDVEFVHVMHRQSDVEYLDFFFTATAWESEPYNAEPEKCDDLQWFDLGSLPANILPYVRQVVEDYTNGIHFSEVGW